ncbi:MAG TPA: polysaccharide biosynthesis/export family protein [Verrucomicrobiae bacterium]|jgi:protein involved in polysaccharide export with SLBB domain
MRLFPKNAAPCASAFACLVLAITLAGCAGTPPHSPTTGSASGGSPPVITNTANPLQEEPLRIGDGISVELAGIPEDYKADQTIIKDDGTISLPYIGRITAAAKTPGQLERDITDAYVPRFYTHMSVTVTPIARYFFVGGQVMNSGGGRILYTGPITVIGAIQSAGDFNPFARRTKVQITRANGKIEYVNCVKALKHPSLDVPIYPGDRIFIPRRF